MVYVIQRDRVSSASNEMLFRCAPPVADACNWKTGSRHQGPVQRLHRVSKSGTRVLFLRLCRMREHGTSHKQVDTFYN